MSNMSTTELRPPEAAPLTPYPLDVLLGRIVEEWETRQRIFDLLKARIYKAGTGPNLSIDFMGREAATPLGPAAGPHSQLAENIVLGWLAGARLFELKTVQILDELEIARPCIDMQTIGYNIEWSQELKIPQSLEEYVKAWMIIDIIKDWEPVKELVGDTPGPHIFDISVGYDLAGISTPEVGGFIDNMMDAATEIDRLRPLIPEPFTAYRDYAFDPKVASTATLSTFHGCPPDEIEAITKHLMTRHGLDVIVKLNPTLLGYEKVDEIIHDRLGYDYVRLVRDAFDEDLQFPRALELIGELGDFAAAQGRRFGIKLTNTLVVENHKGFMPEERMYLSGAPLHTLAISILNELVAALPGTFAVGSATSGAQVSFSAGVSKDNVTDAVGLGLAPVTVCSDLLKPGGYGRIAPMLKQLEKTLSAADCSSVVEWRASRHDAAVVAGYRDAIEAHTVAITAAAAGNPYAAIANAKLPREVDHSLEMWGCVACNFCVTVCPNNAVLKLKTPEDMEQLEDRWQYFILAELCNECGNCMVFCPEVGDPAKIKPRLFIDDDRFALESAQAQAFLIADGGAGAFAVTPTEATEGEAETLATILNSAEGLPLAKASPG
jgi:putative selenate reductase